MFSYSYDPFENNTNPLVEIKRETPNHNRSNSLADYIDYIVKLVGDDFVCLGSDYDGILLPPLGLEDCSKLPNLTRELLSRGYVESSIRKILGGKFLRLF